MPSTSAQTLPEQRDSTGQSRKIHVLTLVLQFDDLLRERSHSTVIFRDSPELRIERCAPDAPAGLRAPDRYLIDDQWLSNEHALLIERPEGAVLIDRGSRNGSYCNGEPVTEQPLVDGDLIQVGRTLLCYRVLPAHMSPFVSDDPSLRLGPVRTLCPEVAQLILDLRKVAPQRESILIMGETGVGKDVVAQEVHSLSRRTGELRAVNCGAVPESLFESTFFGHRRGAFTGAEEHREGEITRAAGGTLFVDEVGTMGRSAQAKLLRVLEDGKVTVLGSSRAIGVDVRWVSATNSDLFGDATEFRPDLLQRLAGYVAQVPPLRRRREDLGLLSAYFLRQLGLESMAITPAAGRRLYTSQFPGNIRQLRAILRVAAVLAGPGPIDEKHLQAADQARGGSHRPIARRPSPPGLPAEPAPAPAVDRDRIQEALRATSGNVTRAARMLSVDPKQVYRWVERYALDLDQLRRAASQR